MTFSKYLEIPHLGEVLEDDITYGKKFVMEEKIDGSNFRFGISGERGIMVGSKNVDLTEASPQMFKPAVDWVYEKTTSEALRRMFPLSGAIVDVIFYGEFLGKPQQNALKYDRIPNNYVMLFDMMIDGVYQDYSVLCKYADFLGLEVVPILQEKGEMFSVSELAEVVNNTKSVLGGTTVEGVVVKSYDSRMHVRKHDYPYMIKYVRDEFKELNQQNWKQQKAEENPINHILNAINREMVWSKVKQHAKDDGKLEGRMQDMRVLIDYLNTDIEHQWKEAIKEELWAIFQREIISKMGKGFPEWYKKSLYEGSD